MIEGCLSPLPGIFFYTPSLPGTYFAVERFRACALQLPGIEVLGLSLPAAGHADTALWKRTDVACVSGFIFFSASHTSSGA